MPKVLGLEPSYETRRYEPDKLKNTLLPIVTPEGSEHAAKINQDLTLYLSRLEKGRLLSYEQEEGRRIFLFIIEGAVTLNGSRLGEGDTARIESLSSLTIDSEEDAFLMLIDLP